MRISSGRSFGVMCEGCADAPTMKTLARKSIPTIAMPLLYHLVIGAWDEDVVVVDEVVVVNNEEGRDEKEAVRYSEEDSSESTTEGIGDEDVATEGLRLVAGGDDCLRASGVRLGQGILSL